MPRRSANKTQNKSRKGSQASEHRHKENDLLEHGTPQNAQQRADPILPEQLPVVSGPSQTQKRQRHKTESSYPTAPEKAMVNEETSLRSSDVQDPHLPTGPRMQGSLLRRPQHPVPQRHYVPQLRLGYAGPQLRGSQLHTQRLPVSRPENNQPRVESETEAITKLREQLHNFQLDNQTTVRERQMWSLQLEAGMTLYKGSKMAIRGHKVPHTVDHHFSKGPERNPDLNALGKLDQTEGSQAGLLTEPYSDFAEAGTGASIYPNTASSVRFSDQPESSNITAMNDLGSMFYDLVVKERVQMVDGKHLEVMDETGSHMNQVEILLNMIQEVRSLRSEGNVRADEVQFVSTFLEKSGCASYGDLEKDLQARRAFLLTKQAASNQEHISATKTSSGTGKVLPQDSPNEQIKLKRQPKEHIIKATNCNCMVIENKNESCLQPDPRASLGHNRLGGENQEVAERCPANLIKQGQKTKKQMLADKKLDVLLNEHSMSLETSKPTPTASLEPNRKKETKTRNSDSLRPKTEYSGIPSKPGFSGISLDMAGNSESIQRPPAFEPLITSASWVKAQHTETSKTRQDDWLKLGETGAIMKADGKDKDYMLILAGVQHDMHLSDLIHSVFQPLKEVARVTVDLSILKESNILRGPQLLASQDTVAAHSVDNGAMQSTSNDKLDTGISSYPDKPGTDVLTVNAFATWQSRIRGFYKNLTQARPFLERLVSGHKVIKLKDDFCPSCGDRYRWPHLLHCCHRFCFPCVVKLFDEGRRCFKCPICLGLTMPGGSHFGPLSLKIDIPFAREMCEANMSPFCCTLCSSGEDATKFCSYCLTYLCLDCSILHMKTKSTCLHLLENSDTKVGAKPDGELWPMCVEHPGNFIAWYCNTCVVAVCETCCHGDHFSHNVKELKDAAITAKERITSVTADLIEIKNAHQRALINLNKSKQRLENLHRSERRKIGEMSNLYLEQIDTLKKTATSLADDSSDNISTQSITSMAQIERLYKDMITFRDFVTRYLQFGTVEEIISVFPLIENRFCRLAQDYENNPVFREGFSAELKFDPRYPEVTNSIHETFSSLRCHYSCLLTNLLSSPLVRERHHVEPYRPLPYSLDYRYESELAARDSRERLETATGAHADVNYEDFLDSFFRATLPYSRAFGRYGQGEYEFAEPSGVLYLHDCTLAVCDSRNHRIVVYHEDGTYQRTIGQPHNIPGLPAAAEEMDRTFQRSIGKLYFPYRMAQCPKTLNIVVVERPPSLNVQIFTFEGEFVKCFGDYLLQNPRGVAVDEKGMILILESKTMNFFIFSPEGQLIRKSVLGTLEFPNDVTARSGTIYISDNRHHCIQCFDYSLNYKETIGNESLTYYPISVGFNHNDHLVVTDNHNTFNITVFDSAGAVMHGFKSRAKHANCYNVALHPYRPELAVTTKECQVLVFKYADQIQDAFEHDQ